MWQQKIRTLILLEKVLNNTFLRHLVYIRSDWHVAKYLVSFYITSEDVVLYTTPKQSAKRQRICLGRGIPGFLLSHCCLGTLIYHRDLDQYIWRSFWSFKSCYIDHWIRSYGDKLHRRSDFSFLKIGFQKCCLIIWIFQACLEACFVSTMATEKSSWLEL